MYHLILIIALREGYFTVPFFRSGNRLEGKCHSLRNTTLDLRRRLGFPVLSSSSVLEPLRRLAMSVLLMQFQSELGQSSRTAGATSEWKSSRVADSSSSYDQTGSFSSVSGSLQCFYCWLCLFN